MPSSYYPTRPALETPAGWGDQPAQPRAQACASEAGDASGPPASQQGRSHTRRGPQWPNTPFPASPGQQGQAQVPLLGPRPTHVI